MKQYLIIFLVLIHNAVFAQFDSEFHPEEARDMIALFNSYTFMDLYESDEAIIPDGYEKIYSSQAYNLDNKFQVFTKGDCGVISVRGSTDKKPSWLENLYATMIPANGVITLDNIEYPYQLSTADSAAVHAGYVLGVTYMLNDIVAQIKNLNSLGIYNIYLSGHSQGGAICQVLRLYLKNYETSLISPKTIYKTYAFASPKIGNVEFVEDYEKQLYNKGSFLIINPDDLVPTFPLTYSDSSYITKTEFKNRILHGEKLNLSDRRGDGTVRVVKNTLKGSTRTIGGKSQKQINKHVEEVGMPEAVKDINYQQMKSNVILIPPSDFPMVLIDSTLLQNEKFMRKAHVDEKGYFTNDELYKKEPMFYQHKPYNYYVTILKIYFPEEYEKLEMKYLLENL